MNTLRFVQKNARQPPANNPVGSRSPQFGKSLVRSFKPNLHLLQFENGSCDSVYVLAAFLRPNSNLDLSVKALGFCDAWRAFGFKRLLASNKFGLAMLDVRCQQQFFLFWIMETVIFWNTHPQNRSWTELSSEALVDAEDSSINCDVRVRDD